MELIITVTESKRSVANTWVLRLPRQQQSQDQVTSRSIGFEREKISLRAVAVEKFDGGALGGEIHHGQPEW